MIPRPPEQRSLAARATGLLSTIANQTWTGLQATTFQFAGFAQQSVHTVGLVSAWLGHLLWLVEKKFFELGTKGYGGNAAVYACLRLLSTAVPEPPLICYWRDTGEDTDAQGTPTSSKGSPKKPANGAPAVLAGQALKLDEQGNLRLLPPEEDDDGEPGEMSPGRKAGPSGGKGEQLPWDHPLRQIIANPNPFQSEFEMHEMTVLHLGITGRFLAWKERNNLGKPLHLWPLRPDRYGPIYSTPDDNTQPIIGWSYLVPGTARYIPLPATDCLMINLPDPVGESGGLIEGLGPIQVLAAEISADNAATEFVGDLVTNYAAPGVVIQTKQPISGPEEAEALKQAFMFQYGGAKKGEPAIIDQDSTIQTVGFSLQQLEFPQLRNISESRIAAAFGVPAILVGLFVGLDSGIRATIEEQRAYFAETTLSNYWRRIAEAYQRDLATEFGVNILCQFDTTQVRALAGQDTEELTKTKDAFAAGALTVNEYREALGYNPIKGGDKFMQGIGPGSGAGVLVTYDPSGNLVPAGAAASAAALAAGAPTNGNGNGAAPPGAAPPAAGAPAATNGKTPPAANGAKPAAKPAPPVAARAASNDQPNLNELTPEQEMALGRALLRNGMSRVFDMAVAGDLQDLGPDATPEEIAAHEAKKKQLLQQPTEQQPAAQ